MDRCAEMHPTHGRCAKPAGHGGRHAIDTAVHRCHARGCGRAVKPEMLMCFAHWRRVPRAIQRRVWAAYRPGQCDDKKPSVEWMAAANDAIGAVAAKETS